MYIWNGEIKAAGSEGWFLNITHFLELKTSTPPLSGVDMNYLNNK